MHQFRKNIWCMLELPFKHLGLISLLIIVFGTLFAHKSKC